MAGNSSGNSTDFASNENNATGGFIMTLVICLILLLIFTILFCILRRKVLRIYTPRTLLLREEYTLGKYTKAFYSWILPAFQVGDDEVFAKAGLDALVYLRFLRACAYIALVTLPYGIFVLIPINSQGENDLKDALSVVSMSNIGAKSAKLWAHWVAVWIYSIVICYILFREWQTYIKYKQAYLNKGLAKHYAIVVTNLPNEFQEDDALKSHFDKVYPNQVHGVRIIRDLSNWDKLIEKHNGLVMNWEHAKAVADAAKNKDDKSSDKNQKKVEKLEKDLADVQSKLQEEQKKDAKPFNSAFVFFKSIYARNSALHTVWSEQPNCITPMDMPDRTEIAWGTLSRPVYQKYIRIWVARVIVFALVFLWTIPIAFIASIANLKSLAKYLTFLEGFANAGGWLASFVQGILPVVLLAVFKMLLPIILRALARFEGQISESSIDLQAFKDLVIFDFVNTFFVFVLAGSLFQQFKEFAEKPLSIPTLLASSLPNQANFFLNVVAFATFFGNGMELVRVVPLIVYTLKKKFLVKTRREKLYSWKTANANYMAKFSQALLFFLIGIAYSVLSPIIVPFIGLYFFITYVVWMNQLLRVYIPVYEHEGRFWPLAFSRLMVGLLIFQLLMIGVFSLKQGFLQLSLLIPCVVLTIGFWLFTSNHYNRLAENLVCNNEDQHKEETAAFLEEAKESYIRNTLVPSMQETSTDRYEFGHTPISREGSGIELSKPISNEVRESKPFDESSHLLQK